jgi:excisionase family DNA binding protein
MAKKPEGSESKRTAVPPLMLDIPEVAQSLRLSRAKVYRLIYYEGLPVVHFGRSARVSVIALQEWIEQRAKGA